MSKRRNKSPTIPGPGTIDPNKTDQLVGQDVPFLESSFLEVVDREFEEMLQGKDALLIYHKMLADGTVQNALHYIFGRLRSAKWYVEPASNDPEDIQIAAFVHDQLGLDDSSVGKYPFGRLFAIYQNAYVYGMAAGELVLSIGADGKLILDKVVPIHPFNVDEVVYDKDGGPKALKVSGTVKGGTEMRTVEVPIWKTVVFIHDDDGSFTGRSALRAAFPHWLAKRAMILLINHGLERYMIGVPVLKLPKTVRQGTAQWQAAESIVRNFVQKPRHGIILPDDWEFDTVDLKSAMPDAIPYLTYHDAGIARALGIDFNTVQLNSGVQALQFGEFINLTQQTIIALQREFASTINLYLIPKLVLPNWPKVTRFPKLTFEMEERSDFSAAANLMGMIINATKDSPRFPAVMDDLIQKLPSKMRRALGVVDPVKEEVRKGGGANYAYRSRR